jgi:hypothetical protein
MDPGSIKGAQIEVARASSAKDKAGSAKVVDTIEEAKAIHIFRCGIALPLATLSDRGFMELSIVSPDHLDVMPWTIWRGFRMATDTASVDQVRFFELMRDAGMLREVAIGQIDLRKEHLRLPIDGLADDAHVRGITKPS